MERIYVLGQNNAIYDVKQVNIYNDLYKLGKQLYEKSDGFSRINVYNWDKEKNIKGTGQATESLTLMFIKFVENLFTKEIEILEKKEKSDKLLNLLENNYQKLEQLRKIKNKSYNEQQSLINEIERLEEKKEKSQLTEQELNLIRDIIHRLVKLNEKYYQNYKMNYNDILISALYVFVIEELLNFYYSLEKARDKEEIDNMFIYGKISKERILIIIKDIVNVKFHMRVSIDYFDFNFRYIFINWWEIAYFDLFKRLNDINTSHFNNKIIPCKQCGILFAQHGKESLCSKKCKNENERLRKQKSRSKEEK